MVKAKPPILSVNGGSSSLKFALFARDPALTRVLSGTVHRIGQDGSTLTVKGARPGEGSYIPWTCPT